MWSKLDSHHLIHSSMSHQSSLTHSASMLTFIGYHSCYPCDKSRVCFIVLPMFLSRSERCVCVCVYDNMHVLNYMSSGAVHIHPWCHTRGLSMWRNSHTSLRVQSCFLWADPHRLADQLVTSEGWVPGKPDCNLYFQPLKCLFSQCGCRKFFSVKNNRGFSQLEFISILLEAALLQHRTNIKMSIEMSQATPSA